MKKTYLFLMVLIPMIIVCLALVQPLSTGHADMIAATDNRSAPSPAAAGDGWARLSGDLAFLDPGQPGDFSTVTLLLLATGLVGLFGISRKKM